MCRTENHQDSRVFPLSGLPTSSSQRSKRKEQSILIMKNYVSVLQSPVPADLSVPRGYILNQYADVLLKICFSKSELLVVLEESISPQANLQNEDFDLQKWWPNLMFISCSLYLPEISFGDFHERASDLQHQTIVSLDWLLKKMSSNNFGCILCVVFFYQSLGFGVPTRI